ncbi:MAG: transglycosylase domain-containing protein [Gammaproteobacteria bacterium]
MSEHTIREVLKRRSDDTQRVIQRRREHTVVPSGRRKRAAITAVVLIVVAVIIVVVLAYSGWLVSRVNSRFAAARTATLASSQGPSLSLQSTTQFLPNTLLAASDPNFYSNSSTTVSPVTARLVRLYFPDASTPATSLMVVALQVHFSRTDILEAFVNQVPLGAVGGQAIRGFGAASQAYFQKPFAQLQPEDIALLVALAVNPGLGDPRQHTERMLALRNDVLQMDVKQGVLSQAQADVFKKMSLELAATEPTLRPSTN